MSFVAKSKPSVETPIKNGTFWPEIDPESIRTTMRLDGTVTIDRLRNALVDAIASVNTELTTWKNTQIADGYASLNDVPSELVDDTSIKVVRYMRAVGCMAKASLSERYRDYDSTNAGNQKADQMESPIDDLRRDARWAISDIMGIGRNTVELI